MRPVSRGVKPPVAAFKKYQDAKIPLLKKIDTYCSYCERRIEVSLAVEHIQPKGLPAYEALICEWTNFLLACANCNSTKGSQDVILANVLLPDRDNTFLAYEYTLDGKIRVAPNLSLGLAAKAETLLKLTGLDKNISSVIDDNGMQIVVDRASKRMQVYASARDMASDLANDPDNLIFRSAIIRLAQAEGLFSIWMKVFEDDPVMRQQLIDAHRGTRESGCFDNLTQDPITPHPNTDELAPGGRI